MSTNITTFNDRPIDAAPLATNLDKNRATSVADLPSQVGSPNHRPPSALFLSAYPTGALPVPAQLRLRITPAIRNASRPRGRSTPLRPRTERTCSGIDGSISQDPPAAPPRPHETRQTDEAEDFTTADTWPAGIEHHGRTKPSLRSRASLASASALQLGLLTLAMPRPVIVVAAANAAA